jgi:hypothetical protein
MIRKQERPGIKNKNGAVFLCVGAESFTIIQLVFGLTPVLLGLLLIVFSAKLSVGTAALLSNLSGGRIAGREELIMAFYIVFGVLLIFAGVAGFLMFFVLGCSPGN